jgi:DNA-binding transcriptional LysR family regulator
MDKNLDLNSLLLFYEVVNAQSITRAAQQLRLPKSTISRKLTLLEQQLGAMLLKKGPRRLIPTDIGAALFEHCERIAAEVQDAGLQTAEMQKELRGTLRISMPVDFGISWLSRAIGEFALEYPDISLEIDVNGHYVDLVEERYDIGIVLGQLKPSRLIYRQLAAIRRGVYGSPEYLTRHGLPRTVDDFSKHNCIVTEQQRQEGVWTLRSAAGTRVVEVAGKVTVNNIGVARELAVESVGLAILPELMCRNDVQANRLVHVLTSWECPPVRASALILSRKGIPHKTRVFLDFISARLGVDGTNDGNQLERAAGA